MKKATDITFGVAVITALFAIFILLTGVITANETLAKSSLNMFITCEALCVLGLVFHFIPSRK